MTAFTGTQPSEETPPPPFNNAPITSDDEAESRIASLLNGDPPESEAGATRQDDAAPVETQPSGEEAASEPANEPPIAPPASWTADAKEAFNALPRALQETVSKREAERDAETRRAQNEAAEVRKTVETEKQAAAAERQQYAHRLNTLIPAFEAEITRDDFGKLTPQQRLQFAQEDPAGYTVRKEQFDQKVAAWQHLKQEQDTLIQRQQAEQAEHATRHIQEQKKLLGEKFPEFVDEKTGPELRSKVKTLLKDVGYSDAEIDALADYRAFGLFKYALKGLEASSKQTVAQAKVVNLPKVSKPGAVASPGEISVQKRTALKQQIRSMTDDREIANALAQLM